MSIAIISSANRFSVNGAVFKDIINLNNVLSVSLCKDKFYNRFDMLFYFKIGTRNASYTDEVLLRAGPFPNKVLNKAEELITRFFIGKEKIFNIDEELLSEVEHQEELKAEEQEFVNKARSIVIEVAKKMKAEGFPTEVICKALGLSEIEFT